MLLRLMMAGSSSGSGLYWNPADTDSKITLSSGNRVALRSTVSGSIWCSARSSISHNTGKWYAECVNTVTTIGAMMFGIGTSAAALTDFPGVGTTSYGVHANPSGGIRTYYNGASTLPGITQIVTGGYARIAVDIDAGKLWLGVSTSATWAGGGDPAAGTTPTYTFTPGTTLLLMLGVYRAPQKCTLHTQPGENIGSIPSGYSMWG